MPELIPAPKKVPKELVLGSVKFVSAIEASTFATQVLWSAFAGALIFYHMHRSSRGLAIDIVLAQKV